MSTIADAFLDHLVLTFSKLEANKYDLFNDLKYTGPTDWRTDAISRSLETLRKRCVADSDPAKVSPSSVPFSEDEFELDDEWVIVSKNEVAEMETMLSPSNANSLPIIDGSRSQQNPASLPPPESIRADAVRCSENIPLVMPPFFSPFPPTPDTVQELRLLKAQVSDFVRVCNAVSRGDFTQKLYGWADSTVMEQFRVTVNGMVDRVASFSNEIRSNDLRHTLSNDYSCLRSNQSSASLEGYFAEIVACNREVGSVLITVIRSVAGIMNALARGDYSHRLRLPCPRGELLDFQITVNATIEILEERWLEVSTVSGTQH